MDSCHFLASVQAVEGRGRKASYLQGNDNRGEPGCRPFFASQLDKEPYCPSQEHSCLLGQQQLGARCDQGTALSYGLQAFRREGDISDSTQPYFFCTKGRDSGLCRPQGAQHRTFFRKGILQGRFQGRCDFDGTGFRSDCEGGQCRRGAC